MGTWNLAPARRQVSMNDGVWKLWREASGFWQCHTGGVLRRRQDGQGRLGGLSGRAAVEHDFDLNYVRPG
jgi:hypothetical protein